MRLEGNLPHKVERPFVQSSRILGIFERMDQHLSFVCWESEGRPRGVQLANPFLVGDVQQIEDFDAPGCLGGWLSLLAVAQGSWTRCATCQWLLNTRSAAVMAYALREGVR